MCAHNKNIFPFPLCIYNTSWVHNTTCVWTKDAFTIMSVQPFWGDDQDNVCLQQAFVYTINNVCLQQAYMCLKSKLFVLTSLCFANKATCTYNELVFTIKTQCVLTTSLDYVNILRLGGNK